LIAAREDDSRILGENGRLHKLPEMARGSQCYLCYGEWLLKNSFMLEPAEIKSRWDAL
jgi:hypothetical protein